MKARKLDALVVYADREHFATLHYLTSYDPRFEEALLVILPTGKPTLLIGNEGWNYSRMSRIQVKRELHQTFSLLGQPRDKVRPLASVLKQAGLDGCRKVGLTGWKYFTAAEFDNPQTVLDVPCFIADSVRAAAGAGVQLTNQNELFMGPEDGLRQINEPEQLAEYEWIATLNSQSMLDGMRRLRPGMTEMECFAAMPYKGLPFSCHIVVSSGPNTRVYGLRSPTERRVEKGDAYFTSMSLQGANTCRFGWMAGAAEDLPAPVRQYEKQAATPYFHALSNWYETLKVGTTGDQLHHAAADVLQPLGFTLGLNCGHQIAMDEWTHSPVAHGSQLKVRSGMYFQADFFAILPDHPMHGAFCEDGVAVADASLRRQLQKQYPDMWQRIQVRRKFMIEQLGIRLHDDVLPLSNFPAMITPYMLKLDVCPVWR